MLYDFSEYFSGENTILLDDFFDQYTINFNHEDKSVSILTGYYKNILDEFNKPFQEKDMLKLFKRLAKHELQLNHPYVIMTNEMNCFKNLIINKMAEQEANTNICEFIFLFKKIILPR